MNILWLPHAPLSTRRTRSDHLIERLARRHRVTVVDFQVHPANEPWRYLTDLFTHRSRRGPLYNRLAVWRFPRAARLNGWLLNRVILSELRRTKYDVLVFGPAPYLTGDLDFSSLRQHAAIVCDYLDGVDWTQVGAPSAFERLASASSHAVICVSHGLLRQSLSANPRSYYVPNGVDLSRYQTFRATHTVRDCKASLDIDPDTYVVSIIGITCSPRLYFVDAVVNLARKGKKIILLLVGESPLVREMELRAGEWRHVVRAVGGISYADILPYFMATDLGLSAVDDHSYYHFQSPLKIFEYGAMGKPVLASPLVEEVAQMNLLHVHFCDADSESLERNIERLMATTNRPLAPDLSAYDWDRLTVQVEAILSRVASDATKASSNSGAGTRN